jgi:hypothetical protein
MWWMWAIGVLWLLLGVGAALLIGRSIVLADRKSAYMAPDAPNNVTADRPPLTLLPEPPDAPDGVALTETPTADRADEDRPPPGSGRRARTFPVLPVARPPVCGPSIPHSKGHHRPRRSSSG